MKINNLFFLLGIMSFCSVFSQEKFEKEYRVKPHEVPEKSLEFIQSLNLKKKLKWYAEESNDGKTFEAKTCHKKHNFSIEFDENGTLLDVEKRVKFSELTEGIQQKIEVALSKKFKKYSIKKIQIQYSGEQAEIYAKLFKSKKSKSTVYVKYEIIVKGKKEKLFNNYEVLINTAGEIEKELSIKSFNSINLQF
ncbi:MULTISPECIES: hypothetical protein [unclassified Polaribacter]|uniref:hypothetical protein n=1 Tax=unclassified Polaribacter TaxID=196858 RepID=UPI0011BE3B82|nr:MULTISPECIES: hypothetical protein [unclassified Polaribacter]TXD51006.1 hypothetical protein ES043_13920 [Polaribacter sp. IC063]TXD57970.1 hypothetical protein ES044_13440 [Polaribacter sp. IC066]